MNYTKKSLFKRILIFNNLMIIVLLMGASIVPTVIATTSDESSTATVHLSSSEPKKAIAMVPTTDFTSYTIDSEAPANISVRNFNNLELNSYSILSKENASNQFPINDLNVINPVTDVFTPYYPQTNFMTFTAVNGDSYADFTLTANHTSYALLDNDEGTFPVSPNHNFHLKIVVKNTGPISVKIQSVPKVLSIYSRVYIFSPEKALIDYYQYTYLSDYYFFFIAEKTGDYSFIFSPNDYFSFIYIKTQTYKANELDLTNNPSVTVLGNSYSDLTDHIKEDAKPTFEWIKFSRKEEAPTAVRTYNDLLRDGITISSQFLLFYPSENNTYRQKIVDGYFMNKYPKRDSYFLAITDGTAQFLLGVKSLVNNTISVDNDYSSILGADGYECFRVIANSYEVVQFALYSKDSTVRLDNMYKFDQNKGFIQIDTSNLIREFSQTDKNLELYRYFFDPGEYWFIIKNSDIEESWYRLITSYYSEQGSLITRAPGSIVETNNYNITADITSNEYLHSNIDGLSRPAILTYSNPSTNDGYAEHILFSINWKDNLFLKEKHSGETIYTEVSGLLFAKTEEGLTKVLNIHNIETISETDPITSFFYTVYFPYNNLGDYYLVFDSKLYNSSHLLNYHQYIRTVRLDTINLFEKVEGITFTNNNYELEAPKINLTEKYGYLIKVPLDMFNWTEVEFHYANASLGTSPFLLMDISSYLGIYENVPITLDKNEAPWAINVIGNGTFSFGSLTEKGHVVLLYYFTDNFGNELVSLNVSFTKIPTTVMLLTKTSDAQPTSKASPSFDFLIAITGLIIMTTGYLRRKKKEKY